MRFGMMRRSRSVAVIAMSTAQNTAATAKSHDHPNFIRRLARTATDWKPPLRFGRRLRVEPDGSIDIKKGGAAIPYYMEDPNIRVEFAATLAKEGLANRMNEEFYAGPMADGSEPGDVM